jgi:type VI secretion system secreted protein Hcp
VSDRHAHEIDLTGYSFSVTNPSSGSASSGGGGASGRAVFDDIVISKRLDSSSPTLMVRTAEGRHIPRAVVFVERLGHEGPPEIARIDLTDVLLTAITSHSDVDSQFPTEEIHMSFGRIEWRYTPQNPDGSAGAPVSGGWDVRLNRAL